MFSCQKEYLKNIVGKSQCNDLYHICFILQEISEPLCDLKKGVDELKKNKTFKCILSVILTIGNFLNGAQVSVLCSSCYISIVFTSSGSCLSKYVFLIIAGQGIQYWVLGKNSWGQRYSTQTLVTPSFVCHHHRTVRGHDGPVLRDRSPGSLF